MVMWTALAGVCQHLRHQFLCLREPNTVFSYAYQPQVNYKSNFLLVVSLIIGILEHLGAGYSFPQNVPWKCVMIQKGLRRMHVRVPPDSG